VGKFREQKGGGWYKLVPESILPFFLQTYLGIGGSHDARLFTASRVSHETPAGTPRYKKDRDLTTSRKAACSPFREFESMSTA
jgi:hypothetical protein